MRHFVIGLILAGVSVAVGCGDNGPAPKASAPSGTMTNKKGKSLEAPPAIEKIN